MVGIPHEFWLLRLFSLSTSFRFIAWTGSCAAFLFGRKGVFLLRGTGGGEVGVPRIELG